MKNVVQFLIDSLTGNCIVYSGRGMMGKQCLGVVYDSTREFIEDIISFGESGDLSEVEGLSKALSNYQQDNLGYRTVIYFPRLDLTDKQINFLANMQDFCEGDLGDGHPLQQAWDKYQLEYGDIELPSAAYELVEAAVLYGIQIGRYY